MTKPQGCRARWRRGLALAAFALLLSVGCNILRFGNIQPTVRPEKEPVAAVPQPAQASFRVPPQFLFHADFEVNRKLPIFQELARLREQVNRDLQLPNSDSIIQVFLFETREKYEQFMQAKYPNLPKRRAFFIADARFGGAEDLLVYTYWGNGDRIAQDLRHELTHALLHSVLKEVPIWLDEGLAEYYELPPNWKGVNSLHVNQLRAEQGQAFQPNMDRLEQLSTVHQMTPAEYRESWAWVHLMLNGDPAAKKVLVGYLRELRTNTQPAPLRPRLMAVYPGLDTALVRHLAALNVPPARGAVVQGN
jgi:hypothetical protein